MKLGTESTCGYEQVTVRRVRFERSRGFALEAVDGSDLTDILFTDCEMENISSSPIFIRAGERGRFPVTGNSREETVEAGEGNVRLDNRNWVLPAREEYTCYPAKRDTPSYRKDRVVSIDGHSAFTVVSQEEPAYVNPANVVEEDGVYYGKKYDDHAGYCIDRDRKVEAWELPCFANASGSSHMAECRYRNQQCENHQCGSPLSHIDYGAGGQSGTARFHEKYHRGIPGRSVHGARGGAEAVEYQLGIHTVRDPAQRTEPSLAGEYIFPEGGRAAAPRGLG